MFLLALPAGALADIVDRRGMLMAAQLLGLLAAALLAILTLLDLVTPEVLRAGTFMLGIAAALMRAKSVPTWHHLICCAQSETFAFATGLELRISN
ncbi:MFS transporter [Mesorhizobium sp. CAU 1732]|uniref:MFS transporter n=1 Tax=Mesorhizobium sp. CAU 1732 TaxID=3140358 RepID=UPI00326060F0